MKGRALKFSGKGYVTVSGDSLGVTATTARTYTLWVKPTAIADEPANSGLLSKYRHFEVERANFYASLYRASDGRLMTRLTANGTDVIDVEAGTVGAWQHFAFVMDNQRARGTKIYWNGRLLARGNLNYNPTITPEPLVMGTIFGVDDEDIDQHLNGKLDDVRVYEGALSGKQVRHLSRHPRCR